MAETIAQLLAEGRARLAAAAFEVSRREAALLLGRASGLTEAQLVARSDDPLPAEAAARFRAFLERRLTGEPVAYIFGEREFYGRTFAVDDRVLIPRPETEHLIEAALELELPASPRILDVGTGSGAVAVTLALEIAASSVVASDLSCAALAVAAANARRLGAGDRVHFVAADLAATFCLDGFDLAVANAPYIDPSQRDSLSHEVTRFEPALALFAPGRGHSILARLAKELAGLPRGAPILLEIGHDQKHQIRRIADWHGLRFDELRTDLAGHSRVALLRSR